MGILWDSVEVGRSEVQRLRVSTYRGYYKGNLLAVLTLFVLSPRVRRLPYSAPSPVLPTMAEESKESGGVCDQVREGGEVLTGSTLELACAPKERPGQVLSPEAREEVLGGGSLVAFRAEYLPAVLSTLVIANHETTRLLRDVGMGEEGCWGRACLAHRWCFHVEGGCVMISTGLSPAGASVHEPPE